MMEGDGFEDEPFKNDAPPGIKIEGLEEAMTKEERRKARRKKRRDARNALTGKLVVLFSGCFCLSLFVLMITLLAKFGAGHHKKSAAPLTRAPVMPQPTTPAPSFAPKPSLPPHTKPTRPPSPPTPKPTPAPTKSPAPTESTQDQYTLLPIADTYIFRDGPQKTKAFGKRENFLVQKGMINSAVSEDVFAVLSFDMGQIPALNRLASEGKTAKLRLQHQVSDLAQQDRAAALITVARLPVTDVDVETLNGEIYDAYENTDGPTFTVEPSDTEVEVDITDLVWTGEAFESNKLMLLLDNRDWRHPQLAGDLFFSRESEKGPQLVLENLKP